MYKLYIVSEMSDSPPLQQRTIMMYENISSYSAAVHNGVGVTAAEGILYRTFNGESGFLSKHDVKETKKKTKERGRMSCMNLPRADVHPSVNTSLHQISHLFIPVELNPLRSQQFVLQEIGMCSYLHQHGQRKHFFLSFI